MCVIRSGRLQVSRAMRPPYLGPAKPERSRSLGVVVELEHAREQPGPAYQLTCSKPAVHQCPVMAGTTLS